MPSWACIRPASVSLFNAFLTSLFTSFNRLKSLSTEAFENGKDITQATTFRRFGYLKDPLMVFAFSLFCQKTVDGSSGVNSADSSQHCLFHSRSARPLSATSTNYGNVKNSSCSEGGKHMIALLGIRNSTTLKIGSFMLKRDLICLTSSTRNSTQAFLTFSTASGSSLHS